MSIESAGLQFQSDRRQFSLQVKLTAQTKRAVSAPSAFRPAVRRRTDGPTATDGAATGARAGAGGGQSQIGTVEKEKGSHTQKESVKSGEGERERVGMLNGTGRGGVGGTAVALG